MWGRGRWWVGRLLLFTLVICTQAIPGRLTPQIPTTGGKRDQPRISSGLSTSSQGDLGRRVGRIHPFISCSGCWSSARGAKHCGVFSLHCGLSQWPRFSSSQASPPHFAFLSSAHCAAILCLQRTLEACVCQHFSQIGE